MGAIRAWILACNALFAFGCGAAGGGTADGTLADFQQAIARGEYDRAYSMTSKEYRGRISIRDFRGQFERHPENKEELVRALEQPTGAARERATFELDGGERVELVHTPEGWRFARDLADYYDASTPRNALRSFVHALEGRRWDALLRLIPAGDAEPLTAQSLEKRWSSPEAQAELDHLVGSLRMSLEDPIEQVGERATLPYGGRYAVRFLREQGTWKIEDPD